jgi:hypothetical protein
MTNEDLTGLKDRVVRIGVDASQWILKRSRRFLERHPVLCEVRRGLRRIPFEGRSIHWTPLVYQPGLQVAHGMVGRTPGISCEAVPASMPSTGAGMRLLSILATMPPKASSASSACSTPSTLAACWPGLHQGSVPRQAFRNSRLA